MFFGLAAVEMNFGFYGGVPTRIQHFTGHHFFDVHAFLRVLLSLKSEFNPHPKIGGALGVLRTL